VLRSLLILALQWLLERLKGNMATPLTLGITTDVGAVANFLTECAKVGLDLVDLFNSPQMVQGRANVAKEAQKDQAAKDADAALSTGDLTAVDKDLS
jgi:hypothetical protein